LNLSNHFSFGVISGFRLEVTESYALLFIKQRVVVISYRLFRTTYRSYPRWSRIQK